MTSPFREEFVDANVPDHKLRTIGHCPWCGVEQTIDPNEVDGVCTACNARYSTDAAVAAKPRTRRRWRRKETAPPAPPELETYDSTTPRRIKLHRAAPSAEEIANASRAATVLVAFVIPIVFTVIFALFAVRALLH
jgi:hypothetical protein